ncbi:hypothetical protein EJ110_NYTH19095 [Nymphaea thermarum]|nr:hypothetical protein EJ110_NYTH19095 [Nymphaea thermarum]
MSMHSVSLLLERKAKSLEQLGLTKGTRLPKSAMLSWTVKDALPKGLPIGVFGDCKFQEMFHMALESLRVLWKKAGCLEEAMIERENPEVSFSLGLAAAVSRDINATLESSRAYLHMTMGSSVKGWRLFALVSLSEAETVGNLALDETVELDHIGLLRLKCKLQLAQGRPTQAIDKLGLMLRKRLEAKAWQDLSYIYTGLRLWSDASICVNKAMEPGPDLDPALGAQVPRQGSSHRSWRRAFFVDCSSWKLSSLNAVEVSASVFRLQPICAAVLLLGAPSPQDLCRHPGICATASGSMPLPWDLCRHLGFCVVAFCLLPPFVPVAPSLLFLAP